MSGDGGEILRPKWSVKLLNPYRNNSRVAWFTFGNIAVAKFVKFQEYV